MGTAVAQADRVMDRAYRRFGWRIVPVYPMVIWAIGFLTVEMALIVFARARGWTAAEFGELSVGCVLLYLVCIATSVVHGLRVCQPLREFAAGQLDAEQTWIAVVRLPLAFFKANLAIAIAAVPIGLLNLVRVEPLSFEFAGVFLLVISGILLYSLVAAVFLSSVFFPPVLRTIAENIQGNSPPVSGFLLTNRLFLLVPGLGAAMAVAGACVGISPGTDLGVALTHIAVALGVAMVATIPMTLLVGRAVSEPIEDLLDGTRRLREGDYTKRVPELSSDELGDLARSFNEAMTGLADRQQLAREKVQLLDEVRASRARIVAASDASRRLVERNLHDGA